MIIFISDFDLRGSGYMNIATTVGEDLSRRGFDLKAFGFGYTGVEHPYNFSIIPVPHRGAVTYASTALQNLYKMGVDIEAVIVALDIPMQINFAKLEGRLNTPYIGIFPIESGPLTPSWAAQLMLIDRQFIISKFGAALAKDQGMNAEYIEIGIDVETWRPPTAEERTKIRDAMGFNDDDFFILTIADNHERKNLSAAVQALAKARKDVNLFWGLVSRIQFRAGWNLHDLTADYGISDIFMPFERGLEFKRLWSLYAAADAFLLTSKAEGLCMPILEAMAVGVPVVATDCTAITEHLVDGRGFLVPGEYLHQDVWGNSWRTFIDADLAAEAIVKAVQMSDSEREEMVGKALQYVQARTPGKTGDVLEAALKEEISKHGKQTEEAGKEAAAAAYL
jgi:glycosyltransferase involved in cell wall biosynthesis